MPSARPFKNDTLAAEPAVAKRLYAEGKSGTICRAITSVLLTLWRWNSGKPLLSTQHGLQSARAPDLSSWRAICL
mgnify:CR=1